MSRALRGGLLVAVGAVMVVISVLADPIGLGSDDGAFGWKQITGVVVGALVLAGGAIVLSRARHEPEPKQPTNAA